MKKNLFIYSILILSISFMNAQDTTTFDNVVIGTSGPAYGVKIKANFPGGNGGWARSFSISNQNGDQNFISIGTVGLITNGITTGDRSFIGRAYDETYMNFLPNGNVGIGTTNPLAKFVVNASTEGQTVPIKSISIIGPNQPGNQNSAQDLSWDFNSAGSAIIRSYRGGNWDTTLQFLTNSYNGGNAPRVNMHISSEGLVGIGTVNPTEKLDIAGNAKISSWSPTLILQRDTTTGGFTQGIQTKMLDGTDNWFFGNVQPNRWSVSKGDYSNALLNVLENGNVGIGTTIPDSKLTVNGTVHAKEVKVDLNIPAPDYVFAKDYKLKTLKEVEDYITLHSHLPEIPSAREMEKNGVLVGEMNMNLLKKIEELTLYAIEQNKVIIELQQESKKQKQDIKDIKRN